MGRSVALTAVVGRVAAAAIAAAAFFGPTPALADTVVPWVPIGAQAQQKLVTEQRQKLGRLSAALDAMSPLKVLSRGYAVAAHAQGGLVSSIRQVKPGDLLRITLRDGDFSARVTENPGKP